MGMEVLQDKKGCKGAVVPLLRLAVLLMGWVARLKREGSRGIEEVGNGLFGWLDMHVQPSSLCVFVYQYRMFACVD
jgi:hypothetical protein